MKKQIQDETSPYIYEKPMRPHTKSKVASGAVVAAGFVYLTSQLLSPTAEGLPFQASPESSAEADEGTTSTTTDNSNSSPKKRSALGSIQAFVKNPQVGNLGKIETVLNWGNNSAPTGASSGGTTPIENISSPTSATGGGTGGGTAPGNTTSPTSATGGGTGSGTTPGNTTSPTSATGGGSGAGQDDDDDDDDDDFEEASEKDDD